jgi:hypothetical protein
LSKYGNLHLPAGDLYHTNAEYMYVLRKVLVQVRALGYDLFRVALMLSSTVLFFLGVEIVAASSHHLH